MLLGTHRQFDALSKLCGGSSIVLDVLIIKHFFLLPATHR
jgi:hypothetical protein